MRALILGAASLAAVLGLTGCLEPRLPVDKTVGKPLSAVDDVLPETSLLLIQDTSPRVGRAASYYDGDGRSWIVVSSCADSEDVDTATAMEVAVIPSTTYTDAVRSDVADGSFLDAVTCDGLMFR